MKIDGWTIAGVRIDDVLLFDEEEDGEICECYRLFKSKHDCEVFIETTGLDYDYFEPRKATLSIDTQKGNKDETD